MDDTFKQILVGVAIAAPTLLLGLLGWYQAKKTANSNMSAKQIDQLLGGYRDFTQEVQADNEDLRKEIDKLKDQYKLCEEGRIKLTREHKKISKEHAELRSELDALQKIQRK